MLARPLCPPSVLLVRRRVFGGGEEFAGRLGVGGGDENAHPALELQLWLLASCVVGDDGGSQAVTGQEPDHELRLSATPDDRQEHGVVLHRVTCPSVMTGRIVVRSRLLWFGTGPEAGLLPTRIAVPDWRPGAHRRS